MTDRTLTLPSGFDARTQFAVGHALAMLDLQLELVKSATRELDTPALEWQPAPGTNTVGMLLAHMGVAECFWLSVVPREIPIAPDGEELVRSITGMRMADDGFPLSPDGAHPDSLRDWTIADYFRVLDAARRASTAVLSGWRDDELDRRHPLRKRQASRHWILYHTVEHTISHIGQVFFLRQMMRRQGVITDDFRR
jgi:uncharacterized damage-inducible protein DinB